MNRIGLLAAWIVATGIATLLAWQVVGAADDQIADSPNTPLIAVTSPDASTTSTLGTSTSTSETTGTSDGSPSTTGGLGTTTSTTTDSSTSTTAPGSNTSSTTSGIPATTTAVSDGGTVTVTGTEPNVELVAVVAVPGWSYRVGTDQGDRVEVTFENGTGAEIRVRCEWENGQLIADIDAD